MFAKINNVAHIMRRNIDSRNVFIRKRRWNDDASFAKEFTKRLIFNVLKNRQKKRKSKSQRK